MSAVTTPKQESDTIAKTDNIVEINTITPLNTPTPTSPAPQVPACGPRQHRTKHPQSSPCGRQCSSRVRPSS